MENSIMNKTELKNRETLTDFFSMTNEIKDLQVHDYIAVKCDKCGKTAGSTFVDMTGLRCSRHPMDISGCTGVMKVI